MYTEEYLSEFLIRARLRIGDYAEQLTEIMEQGGEVEKIPQSAAFLRIFMNALNADTNPWTNKEKYRRMEYFINEHNLVNTPKLTTGWLSNFTMLPTVNNSSAGMIPIPVVGEGFLFMRNKIIIFVPDSKTTLNALPDA